MPGPVHHCQASIVDGIDSAAQMTPITMNSQPHQGGKPSRIGREIGLERAALEPCETRDGRLASGSKCRQEGSGKGDIDDDRHQLQERRGDGRLAADDTQHLSYDNRICDAGEDSNRSE